MDKYTFCFFVFSVYCAKDALSKGLEERHGRIVGGEETEIESYPYMAYLEISLNVTGYQYCGGFIVDENHIVTAAHCVQVTTENSAQEINIRIGSTDSQSGGYTYTMGQYQVHPDYNEDTLDYDIAVVEVNERMYLDGPNAQPIGMVGSGTDVDDGSEMVVSGWGDTEDGETTTLNVVSVTSVSRDVCNQQYGRFAVTDRMFCAGEEGKGVCTGDSGDPALMGDVVVGVVLEPRGCARPNRPGIYTRIGHPEIRDWLSQVTYE